MGGTVFDVTVARNNQQDFLLSLYMVDIDDKPDGDPIPRDGQQVIRAMDLETLSLVAPEAKSFIKGFQRGVYWTIRYNRGLRLRVMPVFGSARISALFWDAPARI